MSSNPLGVLYDVDEDSNPQSTPAVVLPIPTPPPHQPDEKGLAPDFLINALEVEMKALDWIWEGWLARGKLALLAGSPGTGKTTLAMHMAAVISSGGLWPDSTRASRGNVIIWTGEDDVADTLKPRLAAAGADFSRIWFPPNPALRGGDLMFDPSIHMTALAEHLAGISSLDLLILDPVVSAVQGDSHKNAEVRRGLSSIVEFAQRTGCAVLGITHLTKGSEDRPAYEQVIGSIAYAAVARFVHRATKASGESDSSHMLLNVKNNLAEGPGGFGYSVATHEVSVTSGTIAVSRIEWGKLITSDEAQRLAAPSSDRVKKDLLAEAKDFLAELLASGPVSSNEIFERALAEGYTKSIMRAAKNALRVEPSKDGMSGGWYWSLPSSEELTKRYEDAS